MNVFGCVAEGMCHLKPLPVPNKQCAHYRPYKHYHHYRTQRYFHKLHEDMSGTRHPTGPSPGSVHNKTKMKMP